MQRPSQSHNSEVLPIIQPHPCPFLFKDRESNFPQRTYRQKQSPLSLALSHRRRGNNINFLKRTYSPIDLLTYSLKKKLAAFTLAEVLITLGIIGVIAAMVIPALVSKYRKMVVETELQKAFSIISQVIKMSEIQNGNIAFWLYPTISAGTSLEGVAQAEEFNNLYIEPYIKYIKTGRENFKILYSDGTESYLKNYINKAPQFILADGIFLQFMPTPTINQDRGYVTLVYVGTTNKRKNGEFVEGKNFFTFTLNITDNIGKVSLSPQSYLNWSCSKLNEQRTTFIENCRKNTRETSGVSSSVYCTYMIYCNGWKIPDDYPIRI